MATLELRPLTAGEILDGAITLLRRQFGVLIGISVACEGLPAALDLYASLAGGAAANPGVALLARLLGWVGAVFLTGATVNAVSEAYLGRTPRVGDALRYASGKLGVLFGATLASGLVTVLATLALLVPGVIVLCGYSVVGQVAALEPLSSSTDALRRSWTLTKGFKGKAFVLWLVSLVLITALALTLGFLGGLAGAVFGASDAISEIFGAVLMLVLYPLLICVFTLFYYDLRVRKEAFDLQLLSDHLGGVPAA